MVFSLGFEWALLYARFVSSSTCRAGSITTREGGVCRFVLSVAAKQVSVLSQEGDRAGTHWLVS